MKKLMIVAAVFSAAIGANAAQVAWETTEAYEFVSPTTTESENTITSAKYLAYYIDANQYSLEDATKDLSEGKTAFISTYGMTTSIDGDGYMSGISEDIYSDGEDVAGYMVLVNATDVSKATYAYISDIAEDAIGAKGQTPTLGFDMTGTADNTTWYAVPEPTSGLLLLLGVAGLALRRRRA